MICYSSFEVSVLGEHYPDIRRMLTRRPSWDYIFISTVMVSKVLRCHASEVGGELPFSSLLPTQK
jgi:hypothetical protein